MPEAEQSRFNLRLTADLEADLTRARKISGRSMNAEILARLQLTFDDDPAQRLTDVFRPFLDGLTDTERARFVDQTAGAVEVLVQARKRKK